MFQSRFFSSHSLVVAVLAVTLLLVLLSFLSIQYTNRIVSRYSTLVTSSIEIKQEVTTAHLWFEEIISGDKNEKIQTVWDHYDKASYFLSMLLDDKSELSGAFAEVETNTPVRSQQIRQELITVKEKIVVFKDIARERFSSKEYAGVGSLIDQKYDALFFDILNHMDIVIDELKLMSRDDLEQFNIIQSVLIVLLVFSGSIIGFLLYVKQRRLIASYDEQLKINESLSAAKARLQDLAFCGGDWIWEVDSAGRYTYASKNVVDIIGYLPEEIMGKTPFDLMTAEEGKRVASIFTDILTKQEKISDLDNWNIHKNGERICLRTNGVPIFDDNAVLVGYRGVDKDVTEQIAVNELLMRKQKMDSLGKLSGGIAHDFNNMLGVIIGYTELLLDKLPIDDRLNRYGHQIHNAADRANKLTAKLLAFSRQETLSVADTDINQMLRDDQHMLEKTLTARIQLHFELEVDLWHVSLEKSSLEDAILNICINAMHAIQGSGQLTITTRNASLCEEEVSQLNIEQGDYVVISFIDTGKGMDETIQKKIFEPFFTTKGEQGIGLGLSQVYGFVQQSGGAIQVSSQLEHGTQMVIYLPRLLNVDSDEVAPLTTADSSWDYSGHEVILVVDDEEALCYLAKDILIAHGYKVLCAQGGEKALEILQTKSVDLLFSDVIMPGMDGYELAFRVREKYPHIKIQMASGYSDIHHKNEFDEVLYKRRLQKPYGSKALLKRIREVLDARD